MRAFDALVGDVYELALEKGEIVFGRSEIWTGRIELDEGEARLVDNRKRVARRDFLYLAFLETQDFRPPPTRTSRSSPGTRTRAAR